MNVLTEQQNEKPSTIIDIPLSSEEMYNITENGVWKRLGFSRSVFYFILFFNPLLNNATRSVSSLVYRFPLNAIKTKFSKDFTCICKEKRSVDHTLFNGQLTKFFLPPDWSAEGHLQLS